LHLSTGCSMRVLNYQCIVSHWRKSEGGRRLTDSNTAYSDATTLLLEHLQRRDHQAELDSMAYDTTLDCDDTDTGGFSWEDDDNDAIEELERPTDPTRHTEARRRRHEAARKRRARVQHRKLHAVR